MNLKELSFEALLRTTGRLRAGFQGLSENYRFWKWVRAGRPNGPLPAKEKRSVLLDVARTNGLHCFVETGTYLGDMTFAFRNEFDALHTIELSSELCAAARHRFRNLDQVTVWCGDSGDVLRTILPGVNSPTLFWLDAHYSGGITGHAPDSETPIIKELDAIAASGVSKFAIVIDDARHFTGEGAYPAIKQVADHVETHFPNCSFAVERDLMLVLPKT